MRAAGGRAAAKITSAIGGGGKGCRWTSICACARPPSRWPNCYGSAARKARKDGHAIDAEGLRSRARRRRLPAGDAHMPGQRRALVAAIDDEVMALGLARDRFVDGRLQKI